MARALERSYGVVTRAAEELGCRRETIHENIRLDKTGKLQAARDRGKEDLGDRLTTKAIDKALNGEGDNTMLIFLLKTLFANRGFVEQHVLRVVESRMDELAGSIIHHLQAKGRDDVIDAIVEVIDDVVEDEKKGIKRLKA